MARRLPRSLSSSTSAPSHLRAIYNTWPDAPHSLLSRHLVQRRQRRVLLGAVTGKRSKDPERAVEISFDVGGLITLQTAK